jgi:isopentenyl-diphosphate delta-isomerase
MSDTHLDHVESFTRYEFTSDGRLLLTMRGLAKKVWPSVWANSCYGHPTTAEALPDAASRTLRDERGCRSGVEPILPASRHGMCFHAVAPGDITSSPRCRPLVIELSALGNDPTHWPVADANLSTAA